jgi:CBS-domain-containing membrane protein
MLAAYKPRDTVILESELCVERPIEPPELVRLSDPAMLVFTDFASVCPETITTDKTIKEALHKMKCLGIRLLIVVNEKKHMIGLLSAYQVMGADPIRLGVHDRMDHSQVTVGMVMQPGNQIKMLDIHHLRDAKVGHIVATLNHLEQYYLLVVENNTVRGLFSASQVSRQLGKNILDLERPAHSLAEVIRGLG